MHIKMRLKVVVFCIFFSNIQCALIRLSCQDIRKFVDGHNTRRLLVARGQIDKQPAAANMNSLIWDKELAAVAAKWASVYRFEHNPNRTIASGRFRNVIGENLYWYSTTDRNYQFSPHHALHAWFEKEYPQYRYGKIEKKYLLDTGHYTQMIWAETTHLGCAVSKFSEAVWKKIFVVCNYGLGGNIIGKKPYKTGKKLNTTVLKCGEHNNNCMHLYGKDCPDE